MANESTTWLYEQLSNKGYNVGKNVNEFDSLLHANAQSRQWAYETATNCGLNVGKDIDEFTSLVVGRQQSPQPLQAEQPQANAAGTPTPEAEATPAADANAASSRPRYYKLRRGGRDFTVPEEEVEAAGGLTAWWNKAVEDGKAGQWMGMNLNAPYRVYMHGKDKDGNDFDGHVAMSVAEARRRAGYDYTFTDEPTDRRPTLEDRKRSAGQLANVAGHNEKVMDDSKEWMENMQEYSESSALTPKPVESGLEFDPVTGEAERTYLTHDGRRISGQDEAEWEELKYRLAIADSDMSFAAQMRKAQAQLDYFTSKAEMRRNELAKDDNNPIVSSILSSGDAIMGGLSATTSEKNGRLLGDAEYQQYLEGARLARERLRILQNRQYVNNGGDHGFWREFGQGAFDIGKYVEGSTGFSRAYANLSAGAVDALPGQQLLKAKEGLDNTEAEYGDFGNWARWGGIARESLPYLLDFSASFGGFNAINVAGRAATKGAAKLIGKEAIQEMATMGVKAYASKYGAKGVGRIAGNWTIKAVGTTADELLIRAPLMTNTIQAGKTTADIVDRKFGNVKVDEYGLYDFSNDKTWGSAVWQGEANAIIENYSEMAGIHIENGARALAGIFGGKRISGMLARANASAYGKILDTTRKQFQWMGMSGYLGEVSEEYYGQLWRTMLNLDDAKNSRGENLFFDGQFHGDIWVGIGLSVGLLGSARYPMAAASYAKMKHEVSKADHIASEIFTPEKWEPLRDIIDNTTNEDMGALAESVIADGELTDKEREAALDYMERSLYFRGNNLAATAQSRGAEQDPTEAQLSNSYMDGYNAETPDEMADAQNMYERLRLRAQERFGLRGAIFMDHNPVEVISQMRESGASEEDIQLALDFANARTLRDGMIRRVNDNIDEQIAQSDAKINASINDKSGSIITVVKMDDETPLYVVSGLINTVQNEDGTFSIDNKTSDKDIIVRNSVTGELEFTTPKELYLRDMDDPERVKATTAEAIRRQGAQAAADAMNGVRYYKVGDVVPIEYYDTVVEATIEEFLPDGGIIVRHPKGALIRYTHEDLQEFAHNADMARIDEFERSRQEERADAGAQDAPQEKPSPQYKLNDEFTITYQGQSVRGSITAELDEEGKIEIFTEEPTINGQKVIRIAPAELEMILESYNGEDMTEHLPEGEEGGNTGVGSYGADNWRDKRPDDNYGYQRRADIATDNLIDAARQGDEQAAATLAEYGEEIGTPGVYRFARKEEVDALQQGKHYAGRNGDGKVDVTASDAPTSAASGEYRIKFKPDFDLYKVGNGRTRMKNAEEKDGWIMDGYDIADVESIEQLQPDGTYAEVWRADAQAESAATSGPQVPARSRVPVDEQGQPKYDDVDPDTAWDAIVEEAEGDEAIAAEVVADILNDRKTALTAADKALTKAKEGKPEKRKAGDPQPTMAERIAAKKAAKESLDQAQAARDNAQAAVDHWTKIAESKQRRVNERLNAEQAEARRQAQLRAEAEAKRKAEEEERARKEREALNGVPDWSDDKAPDARARGYRRDGAKKVDRPEVMDDFALGKSVEVKFGNDAISQGHVVIIEAEQLQPSHLNGQRNPSHFLDEAQPKNRKDGASRAAADRIAREIRPEEITSSVTAFTGAPSINGRGEVIQGNNRSDALRRMYEGYPQAAEKYRQYLIDHAQEFGLQPEHISALAHPVLVNMLDVSDEDAIRLGQYVAQDTESGGVERIKPKNAVQKMGEEVSTFASLLLRSSDEDASFAQLVDSNGVEVLKWMSRKGFISDTQYASAFDGNGNLSPEAANDLKAILYQSIFIGGSTHLEEAFNNTLPPKAQRAILATAFRDHESPESERLLNDLQQSITAFASLMGFEQFRNATNATAVAQAITAWKGQTSFDDVTGDAYLPAERFSDLAIALAGMYKSSTQRQIQTAFNSIYNIVQGTAESDLFGEADTAKYPLSEAVRRVLGIEPAPAAKPAADDREGLTENVDQTPTNINEEGVVVDGDGKPLTLYHGTPNDVELSELESGHTRKGEEEPARFNGDGISFTPKRDVAEDYASSGPDSPGKVFEVNVTLKKPYYTVGVSNFTAEEAAEFTAALKAKGYDGIINYASKSMREAGATPNEVIIFDIKSAIPISSKSQHDINGAKESFPETDTRTYELSEDTDEFGNPFVKSSDGTTDFGYIDEESGLAALPIRLSLGENHKDENGEDHGYGYLHIDAGHRKEILQNGFSSVEEFVENVAKNYTDIREGAKIGENQTYLLEVSDEHNNTLYIQLSHDGKYWNVNSAGIFKKKYSRHKPKVYSRPAVGNGTATGTTEVNSGQSKGATAPAGNSSKTSDRKVSDSAPKEQEKGEKSSESATPLMDKIAKGERLEYAPGILDKLCDELAIAPETISEFEPSDEIYEAIGHSKEEIDAMSAEELEKLVPDVVQQIESGWRQALQQLKDRIEQTSNADEKEQFEQQQDVIKQHGDSAIAVFVATLANIRNQKRSAEKEPVEYESELGNVIGEVWKHYKDFQDAHDFDPKSEALDKCHAALRPLAEKIDSMTEEEVEAVVRDLNTFVERLPESDDGWTRYIADEFTDSVMRALKLSDRIKAIEQEAAYKAALAEADELPNGEPNKRKPKISDFVAGKDARTPVIQGVYHDPAQEMAVATDTNLLVMSHKGYDASLAGKIMGAQGELFGTYPHVTRVIPSEDAVLAIAENVDFAELEGKARAAAKADKNAQVAVVCADGDGLATLRDIFKNHIS